MPQVLFNLGRATRTGTVEFTSPNRVQVPVDEVLEIALSIPNVQLRDPTRTCTLELKYSDDGVNWFPFGSMRFVGSVDSDGSQPALYVDGGVVNNRFVRAIFVIGNPADPLAATSMNVGVTVHARAMN